MEKPEEKAPIEVKAEIVEDDPRGDNCCGACRFFTVSQGDGFCHRRAPNSIVSGLCIDDGIDTVWPYVDETDWCGEGEREDGTKF